MYIIKLLGSMKILVKKSVILTVDNVGAILMTGNITTRSCTRHMDIRHKYVNEYVKDGFIEIFFVRFAENDSNILTKNLSAELHRSIERKWWVKSFEMILASKMFEAKRKDVRHNVLTSNILFENVLMTMVSQT